MRRGLWLLVAIALLFPAAAMSPAPVEARSCTGWSSTTRPPKTIRVLRRDGVVEKVDFRRYVGIVMASGEWPSRLPKAMLQAGAIAVKQFAWFHSLKGNHRRSFVTDDGKCYDVLSTTRDQLYRPDRASVSSKQWNAIDATWGVSVRKNGRFMLTQYNAGSSSRTCGSDANGRVIRQRSARDCARQGYSARQILRTYYGGKSVSFNGSGGGGGGGNPAPEPTPKPTPKPRETERPRERDNDRQRERATPTPDTNTQSARRDRSTPRPTPTPTPEPTVVAWHEAAASLGYDDLPTVNANVELETETGVVDTSVDPAGNPLAITGPAEQGGIGNPIGDLEVQVDSGYYRHSVPLGVLPLNDDEETAGVRAQVSFQGDSVRLLGSPGPAGSVVSVYVDDELRALVDLSWHEDYVHVPIFEKSWKKPGVHTVALVLEDPDQRLLLQFEVDVGLLGCQPAETTQNRVGGQVDVGLCRGPV